MTVSEKLNSLARECSKDSPSLEFSICTLVTRHEEYLEMVQSFLEAGFDHESCEFLYLDNSVDNAWDGFKAYNHFLSISRGKYIIICHQDVLIQYDKRDVLTKCLNDLDKKDPNWAIAGNAGGICLGVRAMCITDPKGHIETKNLPHPFKV